MMGRIGRGVFAIACGLLLGLSAARAAGIREPLPTPEWLVDVARSAGLNCRGKETAADAREVEILLRAATRLNPKLADAHVWLHELAVLRDEPRTALEAVRDIVAADPQHEGAFARWLAVGAGAGQTVEQRTTWLRQQLEHGPPQPSLRALIHLELARLALGAMDRPGAREQLERAAALAPTDPGVAELRVSLLDDDAPPETRLDALLRWLALCPSNVETAWSIGLLLDDYGFQEDADVFFDHALEIHRLADPGTPVPATYWLKLARHDVRRGRLEQAAQRVTEAIRLDPSVAAEGGIFLCWLLEQQERKSDASGVREQLTRRFAQIREPRTEPLNEVAQAAWFYCTLDPQPQRALMLAEAAEARAPGDAFITRVLGWARAANLKDPEAERTLRPIADKDPYAAYRLARILKDRGDADGARRVVAALQPPPIAGPAYQMIKGLELGGPASQPAADRYPRIAEALSEFDRTVLDFHRRPGHYLEAEVALDDRSPNPGEPWWAEFSLTNRGPFPISLGPEWMVNPTFLVSIEMEGDRKREYPALLTVNVDRVRVLAPGATVTVHRTISVGPPERIARMTPQQSQRIAVGAILDPLRGTDGQWRPSVAGQSLRPVYLNRLPAQTTPEALQVLFVKLTREAEPDRFLAVEVMAELVGERERAGGGQLNYHPAVVPIDRMQEALLAALGGESWELRARTLDALQIVGLDARMLQAIDNCLEHPHWLVRLMAVRLLGMRQGPAAAPRLQKLADRDDDELVRGLAQNYLSSWTTSAPATQPVTRPVTP